MSPSAELALAVEVSVLPNCRDKFLGENLYWVRCETSVLHESQEEIRCTASGQPGVVGESLLFPINVQVGLNSFGVLQELPLNFSYGI